MSEPMSSGEIEDVLSSIRRLVSEDLRPVSARPAAAAPVQVAQADLVPSKLVLTPSLRVVKNDPEEDLGTTDTPMDPAQHAPQDVTPMEDWLPESSTSQDDIWQSASEDGEDWAAAGEEPADLPTDPPAAALNVTRVVSEIAAAVDDTAEEWEPEAEEASAQPMTWQDPEWVKDAEVVDDIDRDIAAEIADAAEAAAVAEIMARTAPQAEAALRATDTDGQTDSAQDARYFDEEVLRDLVRDLIQEELSGALGERITRNVRKLVRAEINRALTTRALE